jgi:hypothetical protein
VCYPRRDVVDAIRYLDRRWHADPISTTVSASRSV